MTIDSIKEKVKAFVLRFVRYEDLKDDEDYFALGFVNSLFAIQLVAFVEKEFQIKVENTDLDIKNFNSIDAITRLVERKITV
jgi:acyl carrier protein